MSRTQLTIQSAASVNPTAWGRSIPGSFRFGGALLLLLFWAPSAFAIPFSEYRDQVKKAIDAVNLLSQSTEGQTDSQRAESELANLRSAGSTLPRSEMVEWNGTSFTTDNSWFADDLEQFQKTTRSDLAGARLLDRIRERLQALQDRLAETSNGEQSNRFSNDEMRGRLAAILQRSEYASEVNHTSALDRLLRRIGEWIRNLLPKQRQLSPGRANIITSIAQVIVVTLALALIVYVIRLAAPRLFRRRRPKKKKRAAARVVLGERLEPDQSGADLLAEAEALARAGDLRQAIRKGYVALLVELGDRNVISLAQYKTNRDYLRSVREIESLHRNMVQLTSTFEQHWYGLVQANETDWTTFRALYRAALAAH